MANWYFPETTRTIAQRLSATHQGIDYDAPLGSPIFSIGNGTVTDAGPAQGFGNWIRIQHSEAPIGTVYGHMRDGNLLVKPGDTVAAGQRIANEGDAGDSTGPHLHFELRLGGVSGLPVDGDNWLVAHNAKLPAGGGASGGNLFSYLSDGDWSLASKAWQGTPDGFKAIKADLLAGKLFSKDVNVNIKHYGWTGNKDVFVQWGQSLEHKALIVSAAKTDPITNIASTIGSLIAALSKIFDFITNKNNWLRVAMFIAGLALLYLGIKGLDFADKLPNIPGIGNINV